MKRSRNRMLVLFSILMVAFLGLALYLTYFEVMKAPALRAHNLNPRNWVDESQFGRGKFLDRNSQVLVDRVKEEDGTYTRYSKYPALYAHLIGYNSDTYGKSGLEKALNGSLLNLGQDNPIAELRGKVLNEGVGNDVQLTIDHDLQAYTYKLLKGKKGAAVAINPQTGEVLAMVSVPSFDPNKVDSSWNDLLETEGDVLVNRAINGRYTPGSVLKAVSAMALLDAGEAESYEDKGKTVVSGYAIENYQGKAYGKIGLREALIHSSNTYFADLSQKAGPEAFGRVFDNFNFNKEIPFDLKITSSRAPFKSGMDPTLLAANSFGQGEITLSPLHLAMAYGAIANEGVMMTPTLVKSIISPNGGILRDSTSKVLQNIDKDHARMVADYLHDTAQANGAQDQVSVPMAGKSGTAQIAGGSTNALYCAFAPMDKPSIAICLVLEDDGRMGYQAAQPLVLSMLNYWFSRQ